jgi:hypothetical protein
MIDIKSEVAVLRRAGDIIRELGDCGLDAAIELIDQLTKQRDAAEEKLSRIPTIAQAAPVCVYPVCDDPEWCDGEPECRYGVVQAGKEAALIEALRPFAYYFDLNDCEGRSDGDALEIPVSDLRTARDLLKSLGVDTSLPPWASRVSSTKSK